MTVGRSSSPTWDRQTESGCARNESTPAPNYTRATAFGAATRNARSRPEPTPPRHSRPSGAWSIKDPVSAVPHSERAEVLHRGTAPSRKDNAHEDSAQQHRRTNRPRRSQSQPDHRDQRRTACILVHLPGAVVDLPLADVRLLVRVTR